MLKIGSAWARTCVRPVSPCFALEMLKNGSPNGSRPPPNVFCFVLSLVGVQVRQSGCVRNIFVPRKHHRKSRKFHRKATENHGKSRKITENHGKPRKITEGFFHANHRNSRIPASPLCWELAFSIALDVWGIDAGHWPHMPLWHIPLPHTSAFFSWFQASCHIVTPQDVVLPAVGNL